MKIISGGQTGVDQAALDAARLFGMPYGGWCPKNRINENGKISRIYDELKEIDGDFKSEKENYDARTKKNIADSDGTLIFVPKIPLPTNIVDGTVLTLEEVKRKNKPYRVIDLSEASEKSVAEIIQWIKDNAIVTLNIAGPRESTSPQIYADCLKFLQAMLPNLLASPRPRL